ncbi:hypothetical protein CYMTET_7342 [Cymbomonas tetramitiformis]|uniref:Uncharacterized protein n=1 Tax=Cymbomonas tetramitiformis TaxID=36881 RepID=A0AAE0GX59_9CHLO|nr:hypothetical protein CYMTET_7342 [Cymbomonas tetramitiformis]
MWNVFNFIGNFQMAALRHLKEHFPQFWMVATVDFMAVKTLTPLEDQTCKQADNAKVRGLVVVVRRDVCPELDSDLIALNATATQEVRDVSAAQNTSRKDHRKEVEVDHEEAWRQRECKREGLAYNIGNSPIADGEDGVNGANAMDHDVDASDTKDGVDRIIVEDEFFFIADAVKGECEQNWCMRNAADVVAAVNSGYCTPQGPANKRVVQRRIAFLITPEMILQAQREGVNAAGESVQCTRALHDLVPVAPGRVMRRALSCFTCEACCEGKWLDCTNTELCGNYEEARIQAATDRDATHLRSHARREREAAASYVGDDVQEPLDLTDQRAVAHLEVGDNVAVAIPGDDETPPWTMKVTKLIYILSEDHTSPEFMDANGHPYIFPVGSEVLRGFWYQQKSEASYRYELWDDEWAAAGRFSKDFKKNSKAFLQHALFPQLVFPASWVFHSKFDMLQESHSRRVARQHAGDRVFIMSEEDDEEIADAWVAASDQ